jgi:hypothetical protein
MSSQYVVVRFRFALRPESLPLVALVALTNPSAKLISLSGSV